MVCAWCRDDFWHCGQLYVGPCISMAVASRQDMLDVAAVAACACADCSAGWAGLERTEHSHTRNSKLISISGCNGSSSLAAPVDCESSCLLRHSVVTSAPG